LLQRLILTIKFRRGLCRLPVSSIIMSFTISGHQRVLEARGSRTSICEVCRQWINVSVSNPPTIHRRLNTCLIQSRHFATNHHVRIKQGYRSNSTSLRYVRSHNNSSTGCPPLPSQCLETVGPPSSHRINMQLLTPPSAAGLWSTYPRFASSRSSWH
jgi:hypothetical protein